MQNKREKGSEYERKAAAYLEQQGFQTLSFHFSCRQGEIDLIGMTADGWLIFVEVKYRSSEYSGNPLAAVDSKKQWVISRVAVEYLKNRYRSMDVRCRFDVVGIERDEICWVKNAFDFCS